MPDDFTTVLSGGTDRAFTLDDGVTTLVGERASHSVSKFGVGYDNVSGNFLTLTFIGTGLDVVLISDAGVRTFDAVSIDGGATAV